MKTRSILVLVAGISAVLILLLVLQPWNSGNIHVALSRPEDVDRIVLTDSYSTVELVRSDSTWSLFGTEPVNPVAVENLLIAASRLEVSSMVNGDAGDGPDVQQEESRELTFYRGHQVILSYRLTQVSGRYLLILPDSERSYYVGLPGYQDLDLDRIFAANPDHYRDHLLIDLRPSEISAIEVEFPSGEAFRFTQVLEGKIYIAPANDSTHLPAGKPVDLSMRLLFSYFTAIRYEERTELSLDSLSGTPAGNRWQARIGVDSFSGEHHSLQVFPYVEKSDSEPHLFKALVFFDDEEQALIVNYIYLDVLMRGLSHYFGEK